MASSVTDGIFWLVDLTAHEGPYVATVPDFWLIENNTKCYYPRSRGDDAAKKREPGQPELKHRQASQSSAVLEQVQHNRPVITPGLADQSNELPDGSKSVLTKLVKEVLKLQENIANVMTKMVVIEGKIELMARPIESEATAIDVDFMTEPLKEIEDIKALEQTLLDNDKYYQLVTIIRNIGGGSIGKATKKYQKQGLKNSIITKAVFEAVRNTGGRRAKDYELEKITKKMMKGMPEKYRGESALTDL
ncbi:hypothetical protein DAPPUDRAFT_322236 [Daphnia pulex]|uniref:DUF4806 domain-containing protein n=1 Tax=Daphnia pulex TaxID=6669 RepID=E9GVB2_DAPPU|nr:hypothetical protein DAPPUDRAFT_322236 [Daphnia pulex]|eukprot:EFX76626.1 hypothetical protein DAPPUDRAFT_322236 [Daphnia pulex]